LFALSGEVRERLERVWRHQCRGPGRGVERGGQSRLLRDERRLRSDTGQSRRMLRIRLAGSAFGRNVHGGWRAVAT